MRSARTPAAVVWRCIGVSLARSEADRDKSSSALERQLKPPRLRFETDLFLLSERRSPATPRRFAKTLSAGVSVRHLSEIASTSSRMALSLVVAGWNGRIICLAEGRTSKEGLREAPIRRDRLSFRDYTVAP